VSVEMLATSYEKLGFMDGAIENYQKFLKLKKTEKHQEYAFHAAALLENAKRDKEAIAQYVQNIAAYPEDIRNYEHLSALYAANKNYAFAISTFEKMMKLPSVPYEYLKKLADLYFKTGNRELAIATYESYLKNKNNDSEAWFLLGMIYYDSKMYDKALKPLSNAYDLAPDRYECMLALSYTYMLTNNTENAVRILRQSLQNNAKDKESLLLLTECYTMAKDTLNLIDILEKRSTLEPASFDINFQLGGLYIHTGNIENAIKSYERAKRSRPDDERTRHILSELYKKKL
jgi:tetratricopeptide (TPR) repeat protein